MSEFHDIFERSELQRLNHEYTALQELIKSASDKTLKQKLEDQATQIASEIAKLDPNFIRKSFHDESEALTKNLHTPKGN